MSAVLLDVPLPSNYQLIVGSSNDRNFLLQFLQATYQELFPEQPHFHHLTTTLDNYFSWRSPLWWIQPLSSNTDEGTSINPVAGLWLGNAIDQVTGERYAHIFMLYVQPAHRRQGLASALLQTAQDWAQQRGDQQIGLQVFPHNQAALNLYQKNGFQVHALMMLKTNLNPID